MKLSHRKSVSRLRVAHQYMLDRVLDYTNLNSIKSPTLLKREGPNILVHSARQNS